MERILLIGCGGSGKSTMARQLGALLNLPVVHLDQIYWQPGWVHLSQEDFDLRLEEELRQERWIMDGNFDRTLPRRLDRCDTVIFLDYSRLTCLMGVLKRVLTNYGRVRPDMAAGCPEQIDLIFLKWIWDFRKQERPKVLDHLRSCTHVRVIILKNRRQGRALLKNISQEMPANDTKMMPK